MSHKTTMTVNARFNHISEIKKIFPKDVEVIGVGVTAFQRSGLGYILGNYEILSLLETVDLASIRAKMPVISVEKDLGGGFPDKFNTSSILSLPKVRDYLNRKGRVNLFVYKAATPLDPIVAELGVKLLSTPGVIRKPLEDKKVFREEAQIAGIRIPRGENLPIEALTEKKWDEYRQKLGGKLVFQLTDFSTGGGLGTFYITSKPDLVNFHEFVKSRSLNKEFRWVNVCERLAGKAASITGCATRHGVVTGVLQTQIMDQPELVGFRGRSGVWLGHDWHIRFSKKAQLNAEALCKKWGGHIYQKGYKGIFGLDVVVDQNDEITAIECNSRYTGAFPVYTMLQLSQGEMPLDVWHLCEWMGIDYALDIDEVQRVSRQPKPGSHLILHNREGRAMKVNGGVKAGVCKFSTRQTKSLRAHSYLTGSDETLRAQNLPAFVEYLHPGFSLLDIKSDDEFVLADRIPGLGKLVKPGERLGKLMFKRRIIDDAGNLLPEIRQLVEAVYGSFNLQGDSS
ncbi:MAG: ATP-grasp domain protein [candidate division WWE3 bacterium GW2011_GWC2_44_9]|uniref:ATP-grasp domain protein n=1 Tax=candidate division WWE3 bacterium GW2011_GWC2_44_9 TaxID=1619125 RepID=A0A0G1NG23_UNCKA|nr:MAG: ATP-grasp domain protein [candidate division WWE3 bacterium GW2011_GWC2_44_9]